MPLTDTQLILLGHAAQRDDGLLARPDRVQGTALAKLRTKLLLDGLADEVTVAADAPHWREDEDGARIGMRITAAGRSALGLEPDSADEGSAEPTEDDRPDTRVSTALAPRSGCKQARVLDLLARPDGASLVDLTDATGWLPHTARAVLTGLRKRGHAITRERDEAGQSRYRTAQA